MPNKLDVVTFGSGSLDIYVIVEKIEDLLEKGKKLVCDYGAKNEVVSDVFYEVGGGGTNTLFTFLNFGLKAVWIGAVGEDLAGKYILDFLRKHKVDTSFIKKVKKQKTNQSIIITGPSKESTLLVFRGAAEYITEKDIPWQRISQAKWFYLAPFSRRKISFLRKIISFARKNDIKVALNPSLTEILSLKKHKDLISEIDLFFLNEKENALFLNCIGQWNEKAIKEKIKEFKIEHLVVTRAEKGAVVFWENEVFSMPSKKVKIVDTTGAGDAFASAFLASLLLEKNPRYALQMAIKNALSCIQHWGAKGGLIKLRKRKQ